MVFTTTSFAIYLLGLAGWMEHAYDTVHPFRTTERIADPQEPRTHSLMISGKGTFFGSDLFTPGVFDEIWPLHLKFLELTVETSSGNVFSGWDLCSRGLAPGMPQTEQGTPCMITSPFHCFSEYLEALTPQQRAQDLTIVNNTNSPVPYHNRSSYRAMNASAMKAEASILRSLGVRGCPGWTSSVTFPADSWGAGSITWNRDRTQINHVPTLMLNFQMEHPSKLLWLGDVAEVSEAIDLHGLQWQRIVEEFSENSANLEVANADGTMFNDISREVFKCDWNLVSVGLVAMVFCTAIVLWDPVFILESRSQFGLRSLVLVLIGSLSNYYPYFSPWLAQPALVREIPSAPWRTRSLSHEPHLDDGAMIINLVMCFAIMDVFVWIHHFSKLGLDFIEKSDFPDILESVCAKAGRSMLLSLMSRATLVEIIMFSFHYGTVLEVGFRVRSMLFANFLLQCGQLPYLTVLEAQRIKAGLRRYSFPLNPSEASLGELSRPYSKKFDQCGRLFMRLEMKTTLVVASLALTYGCIFVLEPNGAGYSSSALASTDKLERHRTMKMFDNQGTFPVTLLFFNVNAETDGPDMLKLYDEVAHTPRTRPDLFPPTLNNLTWAPPWSSFTTGFYFSTLNDQTDQMRRSFGPRSTVGVPGICSSDGDPAASFENYNRWPALLRRDTHTIRRWSFGPEKQGAIWNEFGDRSHLWNTSQSDMHSVVYEKQFPTNQLVYFYRFYITDVLEDEDIIRAVQSVSDALSASRFDDVHACGPTFTQYQGLIGMERRVMMAAQATLVVQFILSWMLLGFRLTTAHMISSAMMLMELWGLMTYGRKINVFSVIAVVLVVNFTPVFNSNMAVAFKGNAEMEPAQRMGVAMRVALPATLQGSLCILGAILPLFWSRTPLIVQYFALPSVMAVLLGLLHGCIISPAFLACVAQNEVQPAVSLEVSECVGVAIEVPTLRAGPNLLQSAPHGKSDKSK